MPKYRRREEVEAVQAVHAGTVRTPDGVDAAYLPGDWIITTRRRENYVVKPAEFDRLFVLAMPPEGK